MNWMDIQFHGTRKVWEKIPLLLTIPCAILPILMACAVFLSLPFEPMLFTGDHWLAGMVYLLYIVGLGLSFKRHRKLLPFFALLIHLFILFIYVKGSQNLVVGYLSVISLIGTSILNQYYRLGEWGCQNLESCLAEPQVMQEKTP